MVRDEVTKPAKDKRHALRGIEKKRNLSNKRRQSLMNKHLLYEKNFIINEHR